MKSNNVELKIDKISCQGCVNFLEKNLSQIEGISEVTANLAQSSLHLQYDSDLVNLEEIRKKLGDFNYPVITGTTELKVEGMHCASCVARIEKGLKELPGMVDVHVNLADQHVRLEYIEDAVAKDQIVRRIREVGYEVDSDELPEESSPQTGKYSSSLVRNFKIALPITLVIFFISHLGMFGVSPLPTKLSFIILLVLTIPVQFYAGRQFYVGFWKSLKNFTATMDTLVVVGTSSAFIYSLIATFYPGLLSSLDQNIAVYYDTSAIIITLILLGRILENRARRVTAFEIEKLTGLQSSNAVVERDGKEIMINASEVEKGDIIVVKPGGNLPVDGCVIEGNSAVEEAMLTGEPLPREIQAGDKVYAGSLNKTGYFKYRAEVIGKDTVVARIAQSVKKIIASRAPVQRLADKVAAIFVPVVIAIAIVAFVLWMILPAQPDLTFALLIFIAVLIIACPCALGLATPTAVMMGSARGAREGILIKSAEILEKVEKIDTVVFDKTGTLSVGKPEVEEFKNLGSLEGGYLIQLALTLEQASEHPLAEAVIDFARHQNIEELTLKEFQYFPGYGLKGRVKGDYLLLGNLAFLKKEKVDIKSGREKMSDLKIEGRTLLYLAVNNTLEGVFLVSDPLKDEAYDVISELKKSGREVWLLSGDNKTAAQNAASYLNIDNVLSEVLPHEKSEHIKSIKATGKKVAMVGDGINDSPALAEADIGIALGSGTDVAVSVSDITLMGESLTGVTKALRLSEKTLKTIKQNLLWAFGYNILMIPIAAGVIYPVTGILLSPVIASIAMACSSIFVITNSLRLRNLKL